MTWTLDELRQSKPRLWCDTIDKTHTRWRDLVGSEHQQVFEAGKWPEKDVPCPTDGCTGMLIAKPREGPRKRRQKK